MAVETEPQVDCESDGVLSEREVDIADINRDIRCLPDEFPVMLTLHLNWKWVHGLMRVRTWWWPDGICRLTIRVFFRMPNY